MKRAADQAYLRTRLAILDSRRRRPGQLRDLLALPVDELLQVFGLEMADARNGGLRLFEQSLLQRWLDELVALLRPIEGAAQRDLLMQWARRYEVLNLKALIRGKISGLSRSQIEQSLFDLPGFLRLNHEVLLNTDDVMELLRRLEGTPYASLARLAMRRFETAQDPFLLDATLDQQFYTTLGERVNRLEEPDRSALRELVGRVIDRHNLIWMLRYRHNYGLQAAEAMYLSIGGGFSISRERLRRIADAASLQDSLQELPEKLRDKMAAATSIVQVEDQMLADLARRAEHALRQSPSVLGSVFGYLMLRYYEIKTTHAIVLARVRGLPDELVREALFPFEQEAA